MLPQPFLKHLLTLQSKSGKAFYLVGGAVRDQTLGHPIKEFDIAVPSKAKETAKAFAKLCSGRVVALDAKRGIYRVIAGDKKLQFDFTDFDGATIEKDLARRDFTLNAMAVPLGGKEILDPHQGKKDIRAKIIRAVSEKNLKDDPLRLLRAFRFSAELNFAIEPKTQLMIRRNAKGIRKMAHERVRYELMKIFATPRAYPALQAMDKTRLLTALFPVLERSRDLALGYYARGGVLGHSLDSVGCFEDNIRDIKKRLPAIADRIAAYISEPIAGGFPRLCTLKLAVLFHDVAKPHTAKKIKGRLRFFQHDEKGAKIFMDLGPKLRLSSQETELTAKIIRAHLRPGNLAEQPMVSDRAVYRFFRDLGPDGVGVLLSAYADHQSYIPKADRWSPKEKSIKVITKLLHRYYQDSDKVEPPKLIDGYDVMKTLKIKPGKQIGEILESVRAAQVEGKVKTKKEALSYIVAHHG